MLLDRFPSTRGGQLLMNPKMNRAHAGDVKTWLE